MTNPKVSIIIPNYNHAAFLQQRIDSVLEQTYQDVELILLDDASTDNSNDIINRYKEHPKVTHVLVNTQNSGSPFKQWQKGIALAKGSYIWIAESDDYCELNFLETVLRQFDQYQNLGLVYAQSMDVDAQGKTLLHRKEYTAEFQPNIWEQEFIMEGKQFVEAYLKVKNVIPNASAVVFKKSIVDAVMFTPELLHMKMCGDWLFWIQLSLKTHIGFVQQELNYFRNHAAVSRAHVGIEKKKQRLLEEKVVRSFLQSGNYSDTKLEYRLYKKWFKLHSEKAMLTKSFYVIKLNKTTIFRFLKYLIKHYRSKN